VNVHSACVPRSAPSLLPLPLTIAAMTLHGPVDSTKCSTS
jgi:hypothetical protein